MPGWCEKADSRQQSRFVAFGSDGGAEVDDEAENLLPQKDSRGGAVVGYRLPACRGRALVKPCRVFSSV